MSTTTYVFVENYLRYQHFSDEKSALSVAMLIVGFVVSLLKNMYVFRKTCYWLEVPQ